MKHQLKLFPLIAIAFACGCTAQSQPQVSLQTQNVAQTQTGAILSETPIVFEAKSGQTAPAFEGTFNVPENRADPNSRTLTLHYVRFPAIGDKKGAPIIYLAGGPGGSGIQTAKYRRLPLFLAMREFGDVIALDQRGTGASNDTPGCTSSQIIDASRDVSDAEFLKMYQTGLKECLDFWAQENIDVRGYTTPENVADLEALRIHLGADKLSLWGISYGSHMALAAIKQMGDHIDRVVIASAEGLAQTIKQPARTDAYFARLQTAINTQPSAKAQFADINAMMRRVHARLEAAPLLIQIPQKDGEAVGYVLHSRDMQLIASAMISDPKRAGQLLQIYDQFDKGNSNPLVGVLQSWYQPGKGISYRAMPIMMDIASGIGVDTRKIIEKQAETSLLGGYLNSTLGLVDVDPSFDLGDQFREKPVSDVPLLLLTGTLDGRTYIKSQYEAVSGLSHAQKVRVTNAGHNLFMLSSTEVRPGVLAAIQEFMRGGSVDGREVIAELPEF